MVALATSFQMPFQSGRLTISGEYGVPGGLPSLPTYIHLGQDFSGAPIGTPIYAAANGTVVDVGSFNPSFGNYVIIQHTLPSLITVYTLYAHMNSTSVVVGQDVLMGTQVGGLGNTGAAVGSYPTHLHFEVSYVNKFLDAGPYGKGYDSPTEFLTSKLYTVRPTDFVSSHAVSSTQQGSANPDLIWGFSFSETLLGNGGNDTIYGNAGNDLIDGGIGADRMFGGVGNDAYVVENSGDTVVESANEGIDTVWTSISYMLVANVENLSFMGSSAINGIGNSLNNTIVGNAASNGIDGKSGNDTLTGGGGADHFWFTSNLSATLNFDTISDFSRVQGDKIDLDHFIFTALHVVPSGSALWATDFRANSLGVATAITDRIIYNTTTGVLSYDRDGSGSAAPVPFAVISGHPTLAASDFIYR